VTLGTTLGDNTDGSCTNARIPRNSQSPCTHFSKPPISTLACLLKQHAQLPLGQTCELQCAPRHEEECNEEKQLKAHHLPRGVAIEAIVFQDLFAVDFHRGIAGKVGALPLELIDHLRAPGVAQEVDVGIPLPPLGHVVKTHQETSKEEK
jgi:hypothetical protein